MMPFDPVKALQMLDELLPLEKRQLVAHLKLVHSEPLNLSVEETLKRHKIRLRNKIN